MSYDVVGVMNAPTGQPVKVVVVNGRSIDDDAVKGFPTLTENIIIAINGDHLRDAIMEIGGDEEAPTDDDIDRAMLFFVPNIANEVREVLRRTPNPDPFDLAKEAE